MNQPRCACGGTWGSSFQEGTDLIGVNFSHNESTRLKEGNTDVWYVHKGNSHAQNNWTALFSRLLPIIHFLEGVMPPFSTVSGPFIYPSSITS